MRTALFWIFSVMAVGSALGVVGSLRSPINSALSLVLSMLALAGLYVLLEAQFVGLIQVMVYAGAIVVLFLFGIMLTRAPMGSSTELDNGSQAKIVAATRGPQ